MTIDERLEALAQTVELSAQMHRDLERDLDEKIRRLALIAEQNEIRIAELRDAIAGLTGQLDLDPLSARIELDNAEAADLPRARRFPLTHPLTCPAAFPLCRQHRG